ncbi:Gldg family protein [Maricaulis sp.]|uniref:Gldg family protein n=1 Tax=Maricaulis sp. TaxID=1486257 RepID=UPI00262A5F53|nr:Gldg family protein [Maricaulis sp.]
MKRALYLPLMLTSIVVLFLAGNHLVSQGPAGVRLDLTQNGLYRLSPGSEDILDRLNEPVEWRFYYSRALAADYPAIRSYATRVREFLRGYEKRSGGRLELIEIDPQPFSEDEDLALSAGLTPIPTDTGETIFFGLVARNSIDQQAVIPLFDPEMEARLEYDLTRTIADIERTRTPRLAILTSLPISPDDGAPNRFVRELAGAYEIDWVEHDFDNLPDVEVLLALHPAELGAAQAYRIDQFLMRGGRLILFLDPMAHMALRPGPDGLPPLDAQRGSSFEPLLAHWGMNWDETVVAMDRSLGLEVQVVEADGRPRSRTYPLWFALSPAQLNSDDRATSALDLGINLGSPGALFFNPGTGVELLPLLTTSPEGALLDADIAAGSPSPDQLLRDYERAPQPLVLGGRLRGRFSTAFPEGPPAEGGFFNPADHLAEAGRSGEVAIIADADWLDDTFYVRRDAVGSELIVADNLNLAMNLVDAAFGDEALVRLRSRTPSDRPMLRVEALRAQAEERYFETQSRLESEISAAEAELERLQGTGGTSALYGGDQQLRSDALALRAQISDARRQLRDVERDFRQDIDALDASLQFWTIGVPPALVIFGAILGSLVRRRRRKP